VSEQKETANGGNIHFVLQLRLAGCPSRIQTKIADHFSKVGHTIGVQY
jgi:hypothetical protein